MKNALLFTVWIAEFYGNEVHIDSLRQLFFLDGCTRNLLVESLKSMCSIFVIHSSWHFSDFHKGVDSKDHVIRVLKALESASGGDVRARTSAMDQPAKCQTVPPTRPIQPKAPSVPAPMPPAAVIAPFAQANNRPSTSQAASVTQVQDLQYSREKIGILHSQKYPETKAQVLNGLAKTDSTGLLASRSDSISLQEISVDEVDSTNTLTQVRQLGQGVSVQAFVSFEKKLFK